MTSSYSKVPLYKIYDLIAADNQNHDILLFLCCKGIFIITFR